MENKDRIGKILLVTIIIILGFVAYKRTESSKGSATVSVEQSTKVEALLGKEDVQAIIKEYILNNPQILIESIEKMHKRKLDEINAQTTELLKSKKHILENDKISPTIGAGPVNIVMIYDYACNFCKKASRQIDMLLADNDKVRIIYKPYPILGDASTYMTKVALTVNKLYPDKFSAIHRTMMSRKISSREDVVKILEENKLAVMEIESEFENADIKTSMNRLLSLAQELKIQGVPVFIINDTMYPGMLDLSRLKELVEPLMPAKSEVDEQEAAKAPTQTSMPSVPAKEEPEDLKSGEKPSIVQDDKPSIVLEKPKPEEMKKEEASPSIPASSSAPAPVSPEEPQKDVASAPVVDSEPAQPSIDSTAKPVPAASTASSKTEEQAPRQIPVKPAPVKQPQKNLLDAKPKAPKQAPAAKVYSPPKKPVPAK